MKHDRTDAEREEMQTARDLELDEMLCQCRHTGLHHRDLKGCDVCYCSRFWPDDTKELDAIVDTVLAYRPKPKSKGAKRRTRRAKKAAKDAEDG